MGSWVSRPYEPPSHQPPLNKTRGKQGEAHVNSTPPVRCLYLIFLSATHFLMLSSNSFAALSLPLIRLAAPADGTM